MEHVIAVDPNKEWPHYFGYWIRIRGLVSFAGLDGALLLAAFASNQPCYALAIFVSGVFGTGCLYILRRWYLRNANVDIVLHNFAHTLRDSIENLLTYADSSAVSPHLSEFHNNIAQVIAEYFRTIKADATIGCCIRLATIGPDGSQQYATVGRSQNYEPSRKVNTVPIPADKGIAATLRDKKTQGVVIIRSIQKAINDDLWLKTPNDTLADIATVMIAPINGVQKGAKAMLGIVYITSRTNKFVAVDTSPLKAVADLLGLSYSRIYNHFSVATLQPHTQKQQAKQAKTRSRRRR